MQDLLPKAERLGALLKARRETVGVSESSSGGLVSAALLSVPGASAYFQGGAVVYLRGQEGRGIGLANKIRAYALQERGLDTVEANTELGFPPDMRDYGTAAQILRALGISRLRLLSNNPRKRSALERYGITVAERRSLRIGPNPHNATYLETKRTKLGHDLAGLKVVSEQ